MLHRRTFYYLLFHFLPYPVLVHAQKETLTFATYNVSMEAQNYEKTKGARLSNQILIDQLASGENQQIQNIAAIIQTVRPDVILLNEFDYISDAEKGIKQFVKGYLNKGQLGREGIDYPYYFVATVNTGQPSQFDLDNNGKKEGFGADAWGYGLFHGQYGMAILSKFPIEKENIRTFQHFKWKDMPNGLKTYTTDGNDWYAPAAWDTFPLSSKSHWDVPILVNNQLIHLLASHPTPPTFDGPEDRNGKRNHDEIRFCNDYVGTDSGAYIYDDNGKRGGLPDHTRFVILGDQNASPNDGDALRTGIQSLLSNPRINAANTPESKGGAQHTPDNPLAKYHTALWRMRADYVLPSQFGLQVQASGVFWPDKEDALSILFSKRESSSDHRMVWVKVALQN